MRPVRFAPCAAGAKPTIRSLAFGSPNDGTGLPQYSWSLKDARFSAATLSRHSTSLGHLRHSIMSLFSFDKLINAP